MKSDAKTRHSDRIEQARIEARKRQEQAIKAAEDSHTPKGKLFVPSSVRAERMAICKACDDYNKPLPGVCGQCKCFMPAKTKLRGVECPSEKW